MAMSVSPKPRSWSARRSDQSKAAPTTSELNTTPSRTSAGLGKSGSCLKRSVGSPNNLLQKPVNEAFAQLV